MFTVLPLFKTAVLFWVCSFSLLVSIVHDRLNVVSWEQSGDAVADPFKPAVIVFLDNVDDGSFHEGQLILLVLGIVIDGHNWEKYHQRKLLLQKCKWKSSLRIADHHTAFPVTDLSLNKPWGPSGGLRQRRDHCNERLRPPLPRSPQVVEEEVGRAPQTH